MKSQQFNKTELESIPLSEDVLTLSFLDVLSCGLGASMCLFLVFSTMPHLGSQSGIGSPQQIRKSPGVSAKMGAMSHSAKFAVVEVEVIVENADYCMFSDDPWKGSFRSAQVEQFPAVALDNSTRLFTVHIESQDDVNRPIHFRILGRAPDAPINGSIGIAVNLFVGGSHETLNPTGRPVQISVGQIEPDINLFEVDITQPKDRRLKWGLKYGSRRSGE